MTEINSKHIDAVINAANAAPFLRHLSMHILTIEAGSAEVEFTVGREHLNPFGGLHGGVYAAAIDTATYWAVYCHLPENAGFVSIDLKVDYLSPTQSGTLKAHGGLIKAGKTVCLAEARVVDETQRCLAHGSSKIMVTQGLQTMTHIGDGSLKLPPKFL